MPKVAVVAAESAGIAEQVLASIEVPQVKGATRPPCCDRNAAQMSAAEWSRWRRSVIEPLTLRASESA